MPERVQVHNVDGQGLSHAALAKSKVTDHVVKLEYPGEDELLTEEDLVGQFSVPADLNPNTRVVTYTCQPKGCSSATSAAWGNIDALHGNVHFQPFKYKQRYGGQDTEPLNLFQDGPDIVALKDTPGGPNYHREFFDPNGILVKAGLPPSQLRTIITARHPLWQMESTLKTDTRRSAQLFTEGQGYVLGLQKKNEAAGIETVPFVVEMYHGMDSAAMKATFTALGMDDVQVPERLTFDRSRKGVNWLEADPKRDPHYFKTIVDKVLQRGEFQFQEPRPTEELVLVPTYLSQQDQDLLWHVAVPSYLSHAEKAKNELHQRAGFRNPWFEEEFLPRLRHEAIQKGANLN